MREFGRGEEFFRVVWNLRHLDEYQKVRNKPLMRLRAGGQEDRIWTSPVKIDWPSGVKTSPDFRLGAGGLEG